MSSAMIYGLLPVSLVKVLGASMASIGLIEGIAEAANSFIKIFSGAASDWIGRRKPLVVFGYALSAIVKTLFPLPETVSTVLAARVIDRLGKGIRDAPRDAFLADLTAPEIRGSGFGLRLALAFTGFVVGPLLAVGLMRLSGDDFRLVFWIALIPTYLSIIVLLMTVKDLPFSHDGDQRRFPIRRSDLAALQAPFWWAIVIASLLSLARFSPAFLVLKAHDIGIGAAYVPMMLVVMYLVYSVTAYPFGVLADHFDRRVQLAIGTVILIGADVVLAAAGDIWLTALGAALWGLQLGVTQGLLGQPWPMPLPIACAAPHSESTTSPSAWRRSLHAPGLACSGWPAARLPPSASAHVSRPPQVSCFCFGRYRKRRIPEPSGHL
jgi:MFS family permease